MRIAVMDVLRSFNLGACSHIIGKLNDRGVIEFTRDAKIIYSKPRSELHRLWSETSWRIARLRDNPACADAEYDRLLDEQDPGITPKVTFDLSRTWPRRSSPPACVRALPSCASRA
jgi:phosphoribosylformylglycinamidine synthase